MTDDEITELEPDPRQFFRLMEQLNPTGPMINWTEDEAVPVSKEEAARMLRETMRLWRLGLL